MKYPLATRIISHSFRVGLITLSIASAALLLTEHTNNIDSKLAVQAQKQQAIQQQAEKRVQKLRDKLEIERSDFTRNQTHERDQLEKQIGALDELLTREMDNQVNGEFKGKRYLELQARQEKLHSTLLQLQERQQQDLRHYSEERNKAFQTAEATIRLEEETQKAAVPLLLDDPNSDNKMVRSFLAALESFVTYGVPTASQFIFAFSLLLAVLIELGIMVAFENTVVALAPLLRMKLAHGLQQEILKTNLRGEQAIQDIQHEADLDSIRRKAEQTVEKAKTYVDEGIFKT